MTLAFTYGIAVALIDATYLGATFAIFFMNSATGGGFFFITYGSAVVFCCFVFKRFCAIYFSFSMSNLGFWVVAARVAGTAAGLLDFGSGIFAITAVAIGATGDGTGVGVTTGAGAAYG